MRRRAKTFLAAGLILAAVALFSAFHPIAVYEVGYRYGPESTRPFTLRGLVRQGDEALPHVWRLLDDLYTTDRPEEAKEAALLEALNTLTDSERGLGGATRSAQLDGILIGLRSDRPELRLMALNRLVLGEASAEFGGARLPSALPADLRQRRNAAIIAALKTEGDPDCLQQIARILALEGVGALTALLEARGHPEARQGLSASSELRRHLDRLASTEPAAFDAWLEGAARDPSIASLWIQAQSFEVLESDEGSGSWRLDGRVLEHVWRALEGEDQAARVKAAHILAYRLVDPGPAELDRLLRPLADAARSDPGFVIYGILDAGLRFEPEGFAARVLATAKAGLKVGGATRSNAALALIWLASRSAPIQGLGVKEPDTRLWPKVQAELLAILEEGAEPAGFVLEELPSFADPRLIAAARALLDSPSLGLRLRAINGLKLVDSALLKGLEAKRLAILKEALSSEDEELWSGVIEGLVAEDLEGPLAPLVVAKLAPRYWRVGASGESGNLAADLLLSQENGPRIVRQALQHKDPAIREGARRALEELEEDFFGP